MSGRSPTSPPVSSSFADPAWQSQVELTDAQRARLAQSPALQQLQLNDDPDPEAPTPWSVVRVLGAPTADVAHRALERLTWERDWRHQARLPLKDPAGTQVRQWMRLLVTHARRSRRAHAQAGVPVSPWRTLEPEVWHQLIHDLQASWEDSIETVPVPAPATPPAPIPPSMPSLGGASTPGVDPADPERSFDDLGLSERFVPSWQDFVTQVVHLDLTTAARDPDLLALEREADRAALAQLTPDQTLGWLQAAGEQMTSAVLTLALDTWEAAHWTPDTLDWISTRHLDEQRNVVVEKIVERHGASLGADGLDALAWVALTDPQLELMTGSSLDWDEKDRYPIQAVAARAQLLERLARHGWTPSLPQQRLQRRLASFINTASAFESVSSDIVRLANTGHAQRPVRVDLPAGLEVAQIAQDPDPLALVGVLLGAEETSPQHLWGGATALEAALSALPLPPDPRVSPARWRDLLRHSGAWQQEVRVCVLRHFGRIHGASAGAPQQPSGPDAGPPPPGMLGI